MNHGTIAVPRKLCDAANVTHRNHGGIRYGNIRSLSLSQLARGRRLQHVICPGGSTAQM
jgi:hypothetical protein